MTGTIRAALVTAADAPTDGSGLLVWNPSGAGLGYEWKFATA